MKISKIYNPAKRLKNFDADGKIEFCVRTPA